MPPNDRLPRPAALPSAISASCAWFAAALLAACAATPLSPQKNAPALRETTTGNASKQLSIKLPSGVYRCELGQQVEVQRSASEIAVAWQGTRHTLRRYDSESGLPRFEDRDNGLVWIDLPWKSVLMDSRNGHPLANECKAAKG
jgi:hypothetical protein